ncbi:MAG: DUF11 domain-containing protein [Planctomycetales bacterium]|nr:DUF11 domain-containing protein [Planctomycetales bacterium]
MNEPMQPRANVVRHAASLWWRWALIVACALILSACRAPMQTMREPAVGPAAIGQARGPAVAPSGPVVATNSGVQQAGYAAPSPALPYGPGAPGGFYHGGYAAPYGHALPAAAMHACGPVGLPGYPNDSGASSERRPEDEYLCDGGDQARPTAIASDYTVFGLDVQDTVVHYDTVDGRRDVEPSNKVCVYAPRFAAVRQVRSVLQHEQHDLVGRVHLPVAPALHEENQLAGLFNRNVQPIGQIGAKQASALRERNAGVPLESAESLIGLDGREGLLTPMRVLETGLFEQADKARLASAIDAAIAWSHDLGVIVIVDEKKLIIDTHDTRLGEVVGLDYEGHANMRIVKAASHKEAQPGDVVEFTLRFENTGDEPVGNVTIIDNLTTRLEYVPDSQSCSREAAFLVEPNEGESLALRWEVFDPVPPGESGVIRFKCLVR